MNQRERKGGLNQAGVELRGSKGTGRSVPLKSLEIDSSNPKLYCMICSPWSVCDVKVGRSGLTGRGQAVLAERACSGCVDRAWSGCVDRAWSLVRLH